MPQFCEINQLDSNSQNKRLKNKKAFNLAVKKDINQKTTFQKEMIKKKCFSLNLNINFYLLITMLYFLIANLLYYISTLSLLFSNGEKWNSS